MCVETAVVGAAVAGWLVDEAAAAVSLVACADFLSRLAFSFSNDRRAILASWAS